MFVFIFLMQNKMNSRSRIKPYYMYVRNALKTACKYVYVWCVLVQHYIDVLYGFLTKLYALSVVRFCCRFCILISYHAFYKYSYIDEMFVNLWIVHDFDQLFVGRRTVRGVTNSWWKHIIFVCILYIKQVQNVHVFKLLLFPNILLYTWSIVRIFWNLLEPCSFSYYI